MAIAAPKKRPARQKFGPLTTPWFDRGAGVWKYPLNDRGHFRLLELMRKWPDPWKMVAGDGRMSGVHAMLGDGRLTRDDILAEIYWAFVCAVKTFQADSPIDHGHVYSWVLNKVGALVSPRAKRDKLFRDAVRPDAVASSAYFDDGDSRERSGWDMFVVTKGDRHEVKADSMAEKTLELLDRLTPEQRKAVECRHGLNGWAECPTFAALGERLGMEKQSAHALYCRAIAQLRRMMNADGA